MIDALGRAIEDAIEETLRSSARAGDGGERAQQAQAAAAARRLSERLAEQGLAEIAYAEIPSPLGTLLVAATGRGLVRIAFEEEEVEETLEGLARDISPRIVEAPKRLAPIRRELEEYFGGRRKNFELDLDWCLIGAFGRRVLTATAAIPFGHVSSYADVAAAAGSPRSARAAGNALGANPIPIVIPCHRVLRTGGALGGYGGGLHRKRWLLEREGAL